MDTWLWPGGAPSWPLTPCAWGLQDMPQRPRTPPMGTGLRQRYQGRRAEPPGALGGHALPLPLRCWPWGRAAGPQRVGPLAGWEVCPAALAATAWGLTGNQPRAPPGPWCAVCRGASTITPSAHRDPGVGAHPTQHRPLARGPAPACHALCTGGRGPKHPSGGLLPGGTSLIGVSMRPSSLHARPQHPPPRCPPCPGWPAPPGTHGCLDCDEPSVPFVPLSP